MTTNTAHTNDNLAAAEEGTKPPGIVLALAPWIAFTLLAEHVSLQSAAVVALAGSIAVALPGLRARQPKILELGAVLAFAGFTVAAFAATGADADWITRYARAIAAALLAVIAFGSIAVGRPFTEQYAREQVPEAFWGSDTFRAVNRQLTALWGGVFTAMVICHTAAGAINTTGANIVLNWVIPIMLVLRAVNASMGEKDDVAPQPAR